MTTDQVIALLRRRLNSTDPTASFTDPQLLQALEDARSLLEVFAVSGMSDYTIDPTDTTAGIQPDMVAEDAHTVVLRAGYDLLSQRYAQLTLSGGLGVVWRSGLEEESTVAAERAYRSAIDDMARQLNRILLHKNRNSNGTRQM